MASEGKIHGKKGKNTTVEKVTNAITLSKHDQYEGWETISDKLIAKVSNSLAKKQGVFITTNMFNSLRKLRKKVVPLMQGGMMRRGNVALKVMREISITL